MDSSLESYYRFLVRAMLFSMALKFNQENDNVVVNVEDDNIIVVERNGCSVRSTLFNRLLPDGGLELYTKSILYGDGKSVTVKFKMAHTGSGPSMDVEVE